MVCLLFTGLCNAGDGPQGLLHTRSEFCPDLQSLSEETLLNASCLVTEWGGTVFGKVLADTRKIKTYQAFLD